MQFTLVLNEYNIIFEQLTTAQATCHKPHKLRNDSHLNNQEILSMLLGNYCFCPLGFKTPNPVAAAGLLTYSYSLLEVCLIVKLFPPCVQCSTYFRSFLLPGRLPTPQLTPVPGEICRTSLVGKTKFERTLHVVQYVDLMVRWQFYVYTKAELLQEGIFFPDSDSFPENVC